ncbi:MAG: hypothetical protein DRG27_01020 [Deltaproteobacteria bacterium]|nr:MAG: hypothetical protein DRG27_01020 [Deltaproteobacteria bacterium]
MSWEAPVKDRRLVAIIPDYLAEYFKEKEVSGIGSFFSSLAKEASHISDNLYSLGYRVFKYSGNPSQIALVGAKDIEMSLPETQPVFTTLPEVQYPEQKLTKEQVIKKAGEYIDEFMKTVAKVGGTLAGRILAEKIAKAAGVENIPEQEIYNRALAWATANQQILQQMGYPSPEAAAASALWAKNGFPPKPGETPEEVLKIKPVKEERVEVAEEKHDIEYYINKYWWLIAAFFALLLLRR